jgi:hypothetical protein
MRLASRVIGIVLALGGLVLVVISIVLLVTFRPESVLQGPQLGKRLASGLPGFVVGAGFILAGSYFFRLDVDRLDEAWHPSRFAPFFIAHRRELKFIAQVGLGISLIRLGAACFGVDWLERWASWTIGPVWAGLLVIAIHIASGRMDHLDWEQAPERMPLGPRIMSKAVGSALWILWLLSLWNQWFHHQAPPRILGDGIMVLLFAWEALFFAYGRLGVDNAPLPK